MAIRLPPKRRQPDLQARVHERKGGAERPPSTDRTGRAGRGAHIKETFGAYWERWLARRRPYLEVGTWAGYEIAGRKRLLPAFGPRPLGDLSVDDVRQFMAELAEAVEAGDLAAKTVNNALGTLVVCLNAAVEDGLLAANPALRAERLPAGHIERDYLRLDEIPLYLDACSAVYRPLAELLIGTGLRVSEALALRVSDLELDESGAGSSSTARARTASRLDQVRPLSARSRSARARVSSSATRSTQRREFVTGAPSLGTPVCHAGPDPEAQQGPLGERRRRAAARSHDRVA